MIAQLYCASVSSLSHRAFIRCASPSNITSVAIRPRNRARSSLVIAGAARFSDSLRSMKRFKSLPHCTADAIGARLHDVSRRSTHARRCQLPHRAIAGRMAVKC
jgi:hypothetical protein